MTPHSGLPVPGYRPQSDAAIRLVTAFKQAEEALLRQLDVLKDNPAYDQRWLSVARTHFEQGYMALNRAVFRPERIRLPEDDQP
jgi:hypothetical protein